MWKVLCFHLASSYLLEELHRSSSTANAYVLDLPPPPPMILNWTANFCIYNLIPLAKFCSQRYCWLPILSQILSWFKSGMMWLKSVELYNLHRLWIWLIIFRWIVSGCPYWAESRICSIFFAAKARSILIILTYYYDSVI